MTPYHQGRILSFDTFRPKRFVSLFLQYFRGNHRDYKNNGSTKKNATDEPKVMKDRGDTELSAAILGRHLIGNK